MFPVEVMISSGEMDVLECLSSDRGARNRAAGVKDRRVGAGSSVYYDLDGVIGERAVAKVLGVPMDLTTHLRSHGVDMVSRSGLSVDVKTSRRPDARLISPVGKIIEADVLILAIIRGAWERSVMVTLAGWARSEDLISDRRRVDPGGRIKVRCPTYVIERSDLLTSSYPFGLMQRPNAEE